MATAMHIQHEAEGEKMDGERPCLAVCVFCRKTIPRGQLYVVVNERSVCTTCYRVHGKRCREGCRRCDFATPVHVGDGRGQFAMVCGLDGKRVVREMAQIGVLQ